MPSLLSRAVALLLVFWLLVLTALPAQDVDERAEARLKRLVERVSNPSGDREQLRAEVLYFQRTFPGSQYAVKAAEMLGKLPSALDRLDPATMPALEKFSWQPKELAGILGEHRGRHGAAASCVAFSPDGALIASGGGALLRLWDPATMRLKHLFGNGAGIAAIAFSRDGKQLAAAGGGLVTVWSLPGGDKPPVQKFTGGAGSASIQGVSFAPNGKTVAVACYDNATRLFDVSGTQIKDQAVITGHTNAVGAVAYSPDGKILATGGYDHTIRLWDATSDIPGEKAVLKGPAGNVHALTFTPNGNTLAVGCSDGKILLYAMPSAGKPRVTFEGKGTGAVYSLSFSATGNTVAAACADSTIRLWNIALAKPVERAKLEGHIGSANGVAYSPDTKLIASAGSDWVVRTWDATASPKPKERFVPWSHLSHVYSAAISPDCKSLASGSYDTIVRLWDIDRPEPRTRNFLKPEVGYVYTTLFSPDGKYMAASGQSGVIKQWDAATGKAQRTCNVGTIPYGVQYSADSRSLFSYNSTIAYQFDVASGQQKQTFTHPERAINGLAWSPDGRTLATGTGGYVLDKNGKYVMNGKEYTFSDCTLRIWEVDSGKEQHAIKMAKPVYVTTFTPDGRSLLFYCLDDTKTRRRDAANPTSAETTAFPGMPLGFSFSPDGRLLITWTGSGYGFTLWDAATSKRLHDFSFPELMGAVSFASDSRHLAVAFRTGVVYILRLGPASVKE